MSEPTTPISIGADRREHERAPIELRVEYSRLNAFFADYTKNISKGGTFIRTEQPLEVGTEFVFQLRIPSVDVPLSLRGKVVRVVRLEEVRADKEGEEDPGMGIRFLYEDDHERRSIEEAAERLMKGSLGEHAFTRLTERERRRG